MRGLVTDHPCTPGTEVLMSDVYLLRPEEYIWRKKVERRGLENLFWQKKWQM